MKIDFRRFKWVGSITQDLAVCYMWHTVNAKTLVEVRALPKVHMGRTNPGSSSDIQQKIFRKLFDVNVHSVAGYGGSAEAFLAVERGELDGGCLTWSSLPAKWIADRLITPNSAAEQCHCARPACERSERLHGSLHDRSRQIIRVLSAAGEVGKPFVFPLGVPDEQVETLRAAFRGDHAGPAILGRGGEAAATGEPYLGPRCDQDP